MNWADAPACMDDIIESFLTLGLPPDASLKMAKKAYRELVKQWHPDRFQHDLAKRQEAEEKIKAINLAFERIQEYREKHPFVPKPQRAPTRVRAKPATPTKPKASANRTKPQPSNPEPRLEENPKPPPQPKTPEPAPVRPPPVRPFYSRPVVLAAAAAVLLIAVIISLRFRWSHSQAPAPAARAPVVTLVELERARLEAKSRAASPSATVDASEAAESLSGSLASAARERSFPQPAPTVRRSPSQGSLIPERGGDQALSPLARELFEKARAEETQAAETRRAAQDAESHYRAGLRHAQGEGVPQDFSEAAKWYRLAAEAGHAEAQKHLGFLYATGKGVPKDTAEAERWLRRAGGQGAVGANFAGALLALSKTNRAANGPSDSSKSTATSVSVVTNEAPSVMSSQTNVVVPATRTPAPLLRRRSELLQTNAPPP